MKNRKSRIIVAIRQSIVLTFTALLAVGSSSLAQNNTIFGPNVYVFSPSNSVSSINSTLSTLAGYTQFDTNRAAALFQPGTYTGVEAEVGYYESVAGLGESPTAVNINQGYLTVNTTDSNGNLTTNFWRSIENLSMVVPTADQSTLQWGVSQGSSFRRINVTGGVELANTDCGEASGGFISDSVISGVLNACSQQQWYTRNSSIGSFTGYVWNYVFSGVSGAPAQRNPFSNDAENVQDTVLATTPVVREKPYLYVDGSGNYWVFSPSLQTNSTGQDWSNGGLGAGTSLPISSFYIATPSSTLAAINAALASGENLILTPGIYSYSGSINVTNPNTVVLGLGYADLVPQAGTAALTVADVDGVQLAGFLIDAGPVNSPVLLQIGVNGASRVSHASNPTSVSDVSFRIGGATAGTATTSMEVDSDNVILDNIWAWRADHGTDAAWTGNVATHGLVVNGDYVTALGLAVEHYQAEQVLWNGENGETIFYQSEMPYDVPSQAAWMDGSADGYASYNVSPGVANHSAYGVGVYSYFDQGVNIIANSGIIAPVSVGVTFTDPFTVFLNGSGQITNTIASNSSTADNAGTTVNTGNSISDVSTWGGTSGGCAAVPTTPGTPTATGGSGGTISVAWGSSSEGPNCTLSYNLFRSTTSGFTPSPSNMIASDLATGSFADTGVVSGTVYYYAVQAANGDGSSAVSAEGSGSTTGSGNGTSGGTGSGGSTSYTYGVTDDSTSLVVSFTGTPACESAILSYVLNGGAQLNVQMTNSGGNFSYTIPGITAGAAETLSYYFTYVQSDGSQFGPTTTYTWTRGSGGGTTSGDAPYNGTAAAIPGTVQAENYDTGGQAVAYNVTSINGSANSYRSDGVDLEATTDTGGGYDLGWTTTGQWFNYTVNVATAGTYTVTFRVAAPSAVGDAFHISNSSGANLSGSVAVPATGGWQTWTNVTATVTLPAGQQTLTFNQDTAGWNLNWFSFATGGGTGTGNCSSVSAITVGSTTFTPQWCQEFNGAAGSPDTTAWNFDLGNNSGWGNNEVEVYCGPAGYPGNPSQCPTTFSPSTAPVYVDGNGHLVIQPINVNGTWISGRMNTENLQNFQYGIIEASIQVPDTTNQGLWPAFWSLGSNIGSVGWPTSGEADFMEDWSTQVDGGPGPAGIRSTIHTALTGGTGVGDAYGFPSGQAADTAYHTYGIIWTANEMQFFVDDPSTPFFTVTPNSLPSGDTWPFNADLFLLLNVAVGGTLGGSTADLSNPQPMMVDYVRYYTAQ